MSHPRLDAFDHALHTAHTWVADVARELDSEDRRYAYRVLRSWLHTLRDRLPVTGAAAFAAQLPELLRGVFYDGWEPARVPRKYSPGEYLLRFAEEARLPMADAQRVALAVTRAVGEHLSPGLLTETLELLPRGVRAVLLDGRSTPHAEEETPPAATPERAETSLESRLERLEEKMSSMAEAITVLARGLEEPPGQEPDAERSARAARLAHEILLASRG